MTEQIKSVTLKHIEMLPENFDMNNMQIAEFYQLL